MSEQEKGKADDKANGDGGKADASQKTANEKPITQDDLNREADRRVNEAQKKWKSEQDALIADRTKDAEAKLQELQTKAEEASRKADFMSVAIAGGIKNLEAAYLVAVAHGHFTRAGKLDLVGLKEDVPEFFVSTTARADAGRGSETKQQADSVNAQIRRQFGR